MKLEKKGKYGPGILIHWYKSPITNTCFPAGTLTADNPDITDGFGLLSSANTKQIILAEHSLEEWKLGVSNVNRWDEGCLRFELRINNLLSRDDLRYPITHFKETEIQAPAWPKIGWSKPPKAEIRKFVRDITADGIGEMTQPLLGIECCYHGPTLYDPASIDEVEVLVLKLS